jgi:amidohydrolase
MAQAFGCTAARETVVMVAAVNNAEEPTAVVHKAAEKIIGLDNISNHRTMASEDMGYMLEELPGCYFFRGTGHEGSYPHHHPKFDFDERAMVIGVSIMAETVANHLLRGDGK